jgi:hypothetical protein
LKTKGSQCLCFCFYLDFQNKSRPYKFPENHGTNYQNLLKTRDDITNQIDKMVGFSQQDKQLALQTALQQVNFDQKNQSLG